MVLTVEFSHLELLCGRDPKGTFAQLKMWIDLYSPHIALSLKKIILVFHSILRYPIYCVVCNHVIAASSVGCVFALLYTRLGDVLPPQLAFLIYQFIIQTTILYILYTIYFTTNSCTKQFYIFAKRKTHLNI